MGRRMEQDSPWKEILEDLFEEFLSFFFADIHEKIDFSKGYEFLEQELRQIALPSKTGKRIVDKLVKVFLRNGDEKWLLIHIEIQGYNDGDFPERMYIYNYRIFDKKRKDVLSLALLTDDNPDFRPNEYRRSLWGVDVIFRFRMVKVVDYRDQLAELETSTHPFAIAVRAFLQTLETAGKIQERYSWKKHFLLELYRYGMRRETVQSLYKFIDWIMKVPKELDIKIFNEIKSAKEVSKMPYITTAERIGKQQGMQRGIVQGIDAILDIKFGKDGKKLSKRATKMKNLKSLQLLLEKIKPVQSLIEAEKIFDELELQIKKAKS